MGLTERRGGWDTILPFVVSGRRHPEGSGAGEGAMFPDLFRDDVFRIETRRGRAFVAVVPLAEAAE